MHHRRSSRLLVLDPNHRLLLFRFVLEAQNRAFWATPGGGLERGETFAQAALRELREETGWTVDAIGEPVARREFTMTMPDGEPVLADERFFLVRLPAATPSREGWTPLEHASMTDHRWWPLEELRATRDTVFPDDLPALLASAGIR